VEHKKPKFTARELFDAKKAKIRANRANFRMRMLAATDEAKALYRRCLRAIRRRHGKKWTSIRVFAASFDVAFEAMTLLTHPQNGFLADALQDSYGLGAKFFVKIYQV